mmetsp:Transcript_73936/g.199279  ORF Transcript_73936/g.199279 Transcript_73936/m.199279 type:complete len:655 (-) Transcript_73936:110-2074(-)
MARLAARLLVLASLQGGRAFDLPDLPDMPSMSKFANSASNALPNMVAGSEMGVGGGNDGWTCPDMQGEMAKYPSGWPTKLDCGIYWYGPGGQFKRATPAQKVELTNPSTWVRESDGYANATERFNNQFYDPYRNTMIFFHGWSGTTAWIPQTCSRLSTMNPGPNQTQIDIAASWFADGWNVGFFYWDQFADEPCLRDAEQKLWFDRGGNGLRWASYSPSNSSVSWEHYLGEEESVSEMCAASVKEAMGDFYGGRTVRFVGHAIGAQLATSCAAKLHAEKHVAAPQRLALLQPFFATRDFSFFGMGIRCGQFTNDDGIQDFAASATVSFVKELWLLNRVVTEIYSSEMPSESGMGGLANEHLEMHTVLTKYDPLWCHGNADKHCMNVATLALYFLSMGSAPPPLVPTLPSGLPGQLTEQSVQPGVCRVPSASCSDEQLRALIERRTAASTDAENTEAGSGDSSAGATIVNGGAFAATASAFAANVVPPQEVWKQVAGGTTLDTNDDVYELVIAPTANDATPLEGAAEMMSQEMLNSGVVPNPLVEAAVNSDIVLAKRDWGLTRAVALDNPKNGMSMLQAKAGLAALAAIVCVSLLVFGVISLGSRLSARGFSKMLEADGSENDLEADASSNGSDAEDEASDVGSVRELSSGRSGS